MANNPKLKQLYAWMCKYPLERKSWLVASRAAGHQQLMTVTREFGPALNLEVATLESWALQRLKLRLAQGGLRYVSRAESNWMVCGMLQEETRRPDSYLAGRTVTPGLVRAVHGAILELREAGVQSGDLLEADFEHPLKGACVRRLLQAYGLLLEQLRCLDWAGLAAVAQKHGAGADKVMIDAGVIRSRADRLIAAALAGAYWVLRDEDSGSVDAALAGTDRVLRDEEDQAGEAAFAGADRVLRVEEDGTGDAASVGLGRVPRAEEGGTGNAAAADVERVTRAAEIHIFKASGRLAEVREAVRRIVASGVPWDQTEVIACDEAMADTFRIEVERVGIACTTSSGRPVSATDAGRAALAYVRWLESGYSLEPLLAAWKLGYIRLTDEQGERIGSGQIVRELERAQIGWGRERYSRIAGLLEQTERELGLLPEAQEQRTQRLLERRRVLTALQKVIDGMLESLDEVTLGTPARLFAALREFLADHAVLRDEHDHQVLARLREVEAAAASASYGAEPLRFEPSLALRYVSEELESMRVGATGTAQPGRLHISTLADGGYSGRASIYILGMKERNWAISDRQDPVLLDEERQRISPELAASTERARRLADERRCLLGRIEGKATFSYCSYSMADQEEQMPAYELLQLYRQQSGRAAAEYEEMAAQLGEAVRYDGPGGLPLAESESWLRVLLMADGRIRDGAGQLYGRYSGLASGRQAAAARTSDEMTAYEGFVDTSRHPMPLPGGTDGVVVSASKLELFARCPQQYFYQEILGVRVNDRLVYDRTRWLDDAQRGSLLHAIWERYLAELRMRAGGELDGEAAHNRERLREITEQCLGEYREEIPAPSASIVEKEAAAIRQDVEMFYRVESRRGTLPKWTELRLHGDGEPFGLELGEELTLPIRGYVDRVDEVAPHEYKIYDYKTGKPGRFKQQDVFAGGKQLQLPLYGAAVEQWLRQTGHDPQARVVASAYYFPTVQGLGEEIARPQDRRQELAELISSMRSGMRQGAYPPTADPKNCGWCDYREVCAGHAERHAEKRKLAEAGGDVEGPLAPIVEVARYV